MKGPSDRMAPSFFASSGNNHFFPFGSPNKKKAY